MFPPNVPQQPTAPEPAPPCTESATGRKDKIENSKDNQRIQSELFPFKETPGRGNNKNLGSIQQAT